MTPNGVHLWRACLDVDGGQIEALATLLSPDEQERGGRFYRAQDRDRFMAGHGLLRRILSRYVDLPPECLRFGYNPWGKPYLCGPAAQSGLRFNVSHSDGQALYALAWNREVGIDLERACPNVAVESLAASFFAPDEISRIQALPTALRRAAFYQTWTRKEAYLKARGQGLSAPLDQFSVFGLDKGRWSLQDLSAPAGYHAALAVEGLPGELAWFDAAVLLPNI